MVTISNLLPLSFCHLEQYLSFYCICKFTSSYKLNFQLCKSSIGKHRSVPRFFQTNPSPPPFRVLVWPFCDCDGLLYFAKVKMNFFTGNMRKLSAQIFSRCTLIFPGFPRRVGTLSFLNLSRLSKVFCLSSNITQIRTRYYTSCPDCFMKRPTADWRVLINTELTKPKNRSQTCWRTITCTVNF